MKQKGEQQNIGAKLPAQHPMFPIIEDAYRVFDYTTPDSTDVCVNCCMFPEIEADFFNPPIRELPLSYLQDWYTAAYNISGISKSTWGYLLPRVLEVLATGQEPSYSGHEVSLNRFGTGQHDNWTAQEWDVLDRFQRDLLAQCMTSKTLCLDDVLCMFALGGWALDDLLEQVLGFRDEVLVNRLHADWDCHCPAIWISAFWEKDDKEKMLAFYASAQVHDRMERLAFEAHTDTEEAEKAFQVLLVIEDNASWRRQG